MATTNRNQRPARSASTRSARGGRPQQRKPRKKTAAQATNDREVQGLLLIALGVMLALALYTGTTGVVGRGLAGFTGWLVGRLRYVTPLVFFWLGWHRLRTAPQPRSRSKRKKTSRFEPAELTAYGLLGISLFSILDLTGGRPWNGSTVDELSVAGGHVGVRIGGTLEGLLGHWGHILLTITMVLVAATILTSISASWVLDAIVERLRTAAGYVGELVTNVDISRFSGGSVADQPPAQDANDPLFDIEVPSDSADTSPTADTEPLEKYIDLRAEAEAFENEKQPPASGRAKAANSSGDSAETPEEPKVHVSQFMAPPPVKPEVMGVVTPQPEGGEWILPSLGILDLSESQDVDQDAVRARGKRLEYALKEHGVEIRLIGVRVGPTISMFEYELAPRVKVARVTSLKADIAYAMATPDVRILAPIPGRQAIGVEVPNVDRSLVTVGDLLVSEEAAASTHPLEVGLGRDITGRTIMINLAQMPHLLVAGQTGSGKSSCINTMLTSILMRSTPDQVRMILVDPKRVELTQYEGLPHLLSEVVTDPKKAANALAWGVREMERRYDLLQEVGVRDITGYNQAVEDKRFAPRVMPDGSMGEYEPLSFILIVLDELADLMMVSGKEVEEAIVRIAQKARAVGIHLIIATQRPSTNVITGLIKANVPARLAFSVSSLTDSRVILDGGGAESLVGRGDGLINDGTTSEPTRFQGAWVTEQEVDELVQFWIKQAPEVEFDPRVQGDDVDLGAAGLPGGSTGDADDDELLLAAMEIVVSSQRASVSDFQRKLRVGFARAGRLMDELEERGVVGPNVGSKVREVLVTASDIDQMRVAQARQAAQEQAKPQQQRLLQPPVSRQSEDPKSTLSSVPNPSGELVLETVDERARDVLAEVDENGRRKALPRPLSESEKAAQASGEPTVKPAAPTPTEPDNRDVVDHAADLVINSQLGSVPMLQRKLRVELTEAERVMNVLEDRGIVGPAQGVRAREVLVKPPEPEAATAPKVAVEKVPEFDQAERSKPKSKKTKTLTSPKDETEELDLTDAVVPEAEDGGEEDLPDVVSPDLDLTDDLGFGDDDFADDFATDEDFDPALAPPPGYPKP
ncbi:MAG: hypothetical protein HKN03_04690 [Acidimicrobiales bacterium]|nr:hypothetical protein [Acidimicrobiales bacterium]